ncbi:MAG: hypothetical protein IT324_27260 [Anaerolineae bacterium]|nr:hypothetical protein [Anaerolineae bacterium]
MRRLAVLILVILIFIVGGAAVFLVTKPVPTAAIASAAPTDAAATVEAVPSGDMGKVAVAATATPPPAPGAINVSSLASPRVLAWNPNKPQLAWYAASGQPVTIAQASSGKALIIPCGLTASGDQMIIYQGGDTAQPFLYPLGNGNPVALGNTTGLACSVQGRTQISPDGTRLGIIKYDSKAVENSYVVGTLRLLKLPEGMEQKALDNVTSFDLQNDGAIVLQFFANTKKEANSADLLFWDGSKERRLEEGIKPLENCQFVAGRSLRVEDKVYTLLGEKCKTGGSKWRLLRTDFAGGNSANLASGPTGSSGGAIYFTNTGANDMWLMPDGKELLIAVPNGLNPDVVNLARLTLDGATINPVLGGVITDQYPPSMPRRFLRSPKGDRLAMVTRDGNGGEKLYLYDLTSPTTQPEVIAGGNRTDRVNALAWTADGERLYYLVSGEDNALRYVTKNEKKLVVRGQFQGLAVSPDGSAAATSEQVQQSTNDLRNNLILVNVNEQSKVTLVEGGKGESALTPLAVR